MTLADSDPQALFNYVAQQLSSRVLAYLHVIEGDTGGAVVPPFDYQHIKDLFGGMVIANNGFDKQRASKAIADGRADLIAFGKPFIGNPDLVVRLFLDAPLMPLNPETLMAAWSWGTTDYPVLRAVAPNTCFSGADGAWGDLVKSAAAARSLRPTGQPGYSGLNLVPGILLHSALVSSR